MPKLLVSKLRTRARQTGRLQTEAYIRAVLTNTGPRDEEDLNQQVKIRLQRQSVTAAMSTPPDLSSAKWKKSSRSDGNGGNCVEVALNLPGVIAVRDSKDPDTAQMIFSPDAWTTFTLGVKAGEFDL